MSGATHELTDMVIKEISLVFEGDNPDAHVLIAKSRDIPAPGSISARLDAIAKAIEGAAALGGSSSEANVAADFLKSLGGNMNDIEQKLADIEKSLGEVTKRATDAEAALVTMTKERDDALGVIAKAKGDTDTEEEMLKALPAPMRNMIEKARNDAALATAAVEKMTKDRETAENITKARQIGIGDADAVGGLFYRIAKGATTGDDVGVLEGILKTAAAVQAPLFQPVGRSTKIAKTGDAGALLQVKADEIKKSKPELSDAQAYEKALDANPALYDDYLASRRG